MNGPMTPTNRADDTTGNDPRQAISVTDRRFTDHDEMTAVRNVALDVRKGGFSGLFGPTEAGETRAAHDARDATDDKAARRVRENQ